MDDDLGGCSTSQERKMTMILIIREALKKYLNDNGAAPICKTHLQALTMAVVTAIEKAGTKVEANAHVDENSVMFEVAPWTREGTQVTHSGYIKVALSFVPKSVREGQGFDVYILPNEYAIEESKK
jgi:hypothetical protein